MWRVGFFGKTKCINALNMEWRGEKGKVPLKGFPIYYRLSKLIVCYFKEAIFRASKKIQIIDYKMTITFSTNFQANHRCHQLKRARKNTQAKLCKAL